MYTVLTFAFQSWQGNIKFHIQSVIFRWVIHKQLTNTEMNKVVMLLSTTF